MFIITDSEDIWNIVKNSDDEEERQAALDLLEMANELAEYGLTPVFLYNNIDDVMYVTSQERLDRKLN